MHLDIRVVNLSKNLLSTWDEVVLIAEQLKDLEALDLRYGVCTVFSDSWQTLSGKLWLTRLC